MTKQALIAEILRLGPEERIDLLNEAWDAIAAKPEDVPVPEWHLRVIEERLADPNREYIAWDELRDRLERLL